MWPLVRALTKALQVMTWGTGPWPHHTLISGWEGSAFGALARALTKALRLRVPAAFRALVAGTDQGAAAEDKGCPALVTPPRENFGVLSACVAPFTGTDQGAVGDDIVCPA